jgi:hypothetical protein
MQKRFFPEGKDKKKRPYQDFRWIRFKNFDPRDMYGRGVDLLPSRALIPRNLLILR